MQTVIDCAVENACGTKRSQIVKDRLGVRLVGRLFAKTVRKGSVPVGTFVVIFRERAKAGYLFAHVFVDVLLKFAVVVVAALLERFLVRGLASQDVSSDDL